MKLGSWEKIEDRKLGKLEVMKIRSWEDGKEMSNDKLQMSNESRSSVMGVDQCQITKAKILLIWSNNAKYNRSDTTCLYRKELRCGVIDRTSAVNPISQLINEIKILF